MKVSFKENKKEEKSKYPYYGINERSTIILFISKDYGVVVAVSDSSLFYIGKERKFGERYFTPFTGTITIE
jgi:hypothetical protein